MSYEKRSKHLEIGVDREYRHRVPKRTKDGLVWEVQGMSYWVSGYIWIDVSITRDFGYYRSMVNAIRFTIRLGERTNSEAVKLNSHL